MATQKYKSNTVFGKLIQPLIGLIERCNKKRKCNALTDHEWIKTGLLRILSQEPSGRAFFQKISDSGGSDIKRSLFFETAHEKGSMIRAPLNDLILKHFVNQLQKAEK